MTQAPPDRSLLASPDRPSAALPDSRPRVLVLVAHPDLRRSNITCRLKTSALAAARPAPRIEVRDLYALYPDFAIDARAEQAAAAAADLIVWVHPIQWYAMPALMKLWVDEVFSLGWCYGPGGQALAGKDLWLVASTGARQDAYHPSGDNPHFFDAFLPPYEQTAALCGLRFLPPLLLHGAHTAPTATLEAHAELFGQRLLSYPAWPTIDAPMETAEEAR